MVFLFPGAFVKTNAGFIGANVIKEKSESNKGNGIVI
jgi:hypothetical protein